MNHHRELLTSLLLLGSIIACGRTAFKGEDSNRNELRRGEGEQEAVHSDTDADALGEAKNRGDEPNGDYHRVLVGTKAKGDEPGSEGEPPPTGSDNSKGNKSKDKDKPNQMDDADRACGKKITGSAAIKINGNQSDEQITATSEDTLIVKVNGNQSKLLIEIVPETSPNLQRICLFVTGNLAKVIVKTSVNIGSTLLIMRGNQVHATLSKTGDGTFGDITEDLNGNDPTIEYTTF